MIKVCTNSACRRSFEVDYRTFTGFCPHCGKAYPRLKEAVVKSGRMLCYGTSAWSGLESVKTLRNVSTLSLKESSALLKRASVSSPAEIPLKPNMSPYKAESYLQQEGVLCQYVPVSKRRAGKKKSRSGAEDTGYPLTDEQYRRFRSREKAKRRRMRRYG